MTFRQGQFLINLGKLCTSSTLTIAMLWGVNAMVPVVVGGCAKKPTAVTTANPEEVRQFFSALRDEDTAIVDRLLSAKPYLANARDESGQTPLAIAQSLGNEELVQVLRRHGAKK